MSEVASERACGRNGSSHLLLASGSVPNGVRRAGEKGAIPFEAPFEREVSVARAR